MRCIPVGPDLERTLGDQIADGHITEDDAHAVRTFALFLREVKDKRNPDINVRRAWLARWRDYIEGTADSPSEEI